VISLSYPDITKDEFKAVKRVLKSRKLAQGEEVEAFENEFSKLVGGRNCIAVNSGTSGLHISLISAGVGPGDEVIVPSFSFAATANSVALTGATPVFVDIDIDTFNINPDSIKRAISSKTKAIQPVHLYGLPANMPAIESIAKENNLIVLEDAAQAHSAKINGIPVGQFGDFATFSFYPTKNMTSGEGGMVVCKDDQQARLCRLLRNQGMEKRYLNEVIGFNLRMTDIHAAIGRVQLRKLAKFTEKRQANAYFYNSHLENVIKPTIPPGYEHVYHQYTIRLPDSNRDFVEKTLKDKGIATGVYYPIPIHRLPSFNKVIDLPNTEMASRQVLSLPVHPKLKEKDLHQVVKQINRITRAGA
jgi:dTDP-4-amino-4,6-dideoxygalactose transaminase